jgi:HD-GYP domain-containing protein (c-di-GMP phosphodiesterase class II)
MNLANSRTREYANLYSCVHSVEFLDNLRTGVVIVNGVGEMIDCNRAATELLGLSLEELAGSTPYDDVLGAVRADGSPLPGDEHPSTRVLETGVACYGMVMGVENTGRSRRWLWTDAYPLFVDGQLEGVSVWFDDISVQLKHRRLLELNTEVNKIVMSALGAVDPLQRLCDALVEHGPYALAWIGLPSSKVEGEIDVAFSAGATEYPYDGMVSWSGSKETGRGPVGTAFRVGSTQVVNDLPTESLFAPWRQRAEEFGLGSCIAIPFAPAGRAAVLAIYDHHIFTFDETSVLGLEAIARESEFGVAHMQTMSHLAAALDGTLAALGQITETRDPYTAGHQMNVGTLGESLAAAIAEKFGLDDAMVHLIKQAGEVHDIGKTCIPSEILTRPGRLSALEYEMVKSHTVVGYEILSKASLPWPIAEVALQHHERLDGSGYPNGLRAGEIILPAKIVAVADVVEAMTQHRPYRGGLGIEKALAEVVAGAGTLFDADVVAACLAVFDTGFDFPKSPLAQVSK